MNATATFSNIDFLQSDKAYKNALKIVTQVVGKKLVSRYGTVQAYEKAEDIASQAVEKFLLNINTFDPTVSKPISYLTNIALRLLIDSTRCKQYKAHHADINGNMNNSESTWNVELTDGRMDALDEMVHNEQVERLKKAMNAPEKANMLEIVNLHYLQEKSVLEICALLNMNENTVKTNLRRGRQYLASQI